MSCVNRIRCGILAAILTAFLLGIVQQESMAEGGSFTLCAYPFPDSIFYQVHMVSYESGTFAALCSPRASYVPGSSAVVKFILSDNSLEPVFSTPKAIQPFPQQLLADNRILTRRTDREKEASWRASVGPLPPDTRVDHRPFFCYEIRGPSTGEVLDITPSNLDGTLEWHGYTGPPFLWSEERGFTFFIPDLETREIHPWQGSGALAEVQRTPPVLALGRGFVDGLLTYAVVTDVGEMLIYDRGRGVMADSHEHKALGKEIATALGAPQAWPKWPVRFVFAEGIAAFKSYEAGPYGGCELVSAAGSRQVIAIVDAFTVKPDGSERDVTEADALVEDASPLRLEGKTQPPDVVASPVLVPVDGRRIGIVDGLYQRLIVISLPE